MDFSLARTNMVKSQVAPNRVKDQGLLSALMAIPRESFIADSHKLFAYSDHPLPMDDGSRRCLKPLQLALLIQALMVKKDQKILVVGAGTGYETAVLARMEAQVFALESDVNMADSGVKLSDTTVQWQVGPLDQGWPSEAPFDGIVLCGSVESIPDKLLDQLGDNGVLVAIRGKVGDAVMQAVRVKGRNAQHTETLFETKAFPLSGTVAQQRFVL